MNENVYYFNENNFDDDDDDSTTYSADYDISGVTVHSTGTEAVSALAIDSTGTVYYSTASGVFSVSVEEGGNPSDFDLDDVEIYSLALSADEGTLFAGTSEGVQSTSLSGDPSWTEVTPKIYTLNTGDSLSYVITALAVADDGTIYAGSGTPPLEDRRIVEYRPGGVLKSTDGGVTWEFLNTGLTHRSIAIADIELLTSIVEESIPADSITGIYEMVEYQLGDYPDVNADGKVYILALDILDYCYGTLGDVCLKSYYDVDNQSTTEENEFSNFSEIIYVDSDPFQIVESGNGMANSFGMMSAQTADEDEDTWVIEGMASMAEFLCGYIDESEELTLYSNNSLISWGDYRSVRERSLSFLTFLYLYEHYFPADPVDDYSHSLRLLNETTLNGIDGINSTLSTADYSEEFSDIYADIALAAILDQVDDATYYDGQYRWENATVSSSISTLPWGMTSGMAPYFNSLKEWAFKLYKTRGYYNDNDYAPTLGDSITFQGERNCNLKVNGIKNVDGYGNPAETSEVSVIVLDENNWGVQDVEDFGDPGDPFQSIHTVVTYCPETIAWGYANTIISNSFDDYYSNPWGSANLSTAIDLDPISVELQWNDLWLGDEFGGLTREIAPENMTAQEFKEWTYSQAVGVPQGGQKISQLTGFDGFNVYREEIYEGESYEEFYEVGATTEHLFPGVPQEGSITGGELLVTVTGNFYHTTGEDATVYVEGTEVGTATAGWTEPYYNCQDPGNNYLDLTSDTILILLNDAAADGQIEVTVVNSSTVDSDCEENSVEVTLLLYYDQQDLASGQGESNHVDYTVNEYDTYRYWVTATFYGVETASTDSAVVYVPGPMTTSKLWSAVSNFGNYGDPNVPAGLPSMEWPAGSGTHYLWEGRLWIGALVAGEKRASHADYGNYEWHPSSTGGPRPDDEYFLLGMGQFEAETVYDDYIGPHTTQSLGLKVFQETKMWSIAENPELSDALLIDMWIVKDLVGDDYSGDVLDTVFVSWVFDCDVGTGFDPSSPHIDDLVDYEGWDGPDSDSDLEDIVENLDWNGNGELDGYDEYGIPYGWEYLGSAETPNPNYDPDIIVPDGYPDEFQVIITETDTILADRMMSYMYDGDDPTTPEDDTREDGGVPGFIGLRLLYSPSGSVHSHQWWNWESDPGSDRDKYDYMAGNHPESRGFKFMPHPFDMGSPTFDYRFMLTTGPFYSLAPGDTIHTIVGAVLGTGIRGLRQNADALAIYVNNWDEMTLETANVYPGDTDNSGTVNAMDILPLGLYFLNEGFARDTSSFSWSPHSVIMWDQEAATFADVNGNGIINEQDLIGIGVNWGNTHSMGTTKYTIDPTDIELLQQHKEAFQMLYNALAGDGEAVQEMKVLLKTILESFLPQEFALVQNYPNPFNPTTTIRFALPREERISLSLYNILGQTVAVMVDDKLYEPGFYSIEFDSGSLGSGVYIYRIQAGEWMKTRKMQIVK